MCRLALMERGNTGVEQYGTSVLTSCVDKDVVAMHVHVYIRKHVCEHPNECPSDGNKDKIKNKHNCKKSGILDKYVDKYKVQVHQPEVEKVHLWLIEIKHITPSCSIFLTMMIF